MSDQMSPFGSSQTQARSAIWFRLLLHHDRAIPIAASGADVANAILHDIETAQLAVDREIEERSISQVPVLVKPAASCLNLLRITCALCTQDAALVPRAELVDGRC
ncbi:hypothetical protein [Sphingomonas glacialis]|uniref:hypothetical protein n=1 Tax=Sphingomonas glacialis TaxID=658225 RepID=UPI0013868A1B|nr:hypothetical protein [Sphingomonas glacialis]